MNKQKDDEENRAADRFALIQTLGLEYSAEFVPFSQSRNAKDKDKSLNWRTTIKRGAASLTTDYMQGIGHIPGYKMPWGGKRTLHDQAVIDAACDHGRKHFSGSVALAGNKIPAPALQDVLYSLLLDSNVLNHSTFEEWAGDFGYDTDSRSAEKIYRACLEIALKLRAVLGDENMRKLQDLYQDY